MNKFDVIVIGAGPAGLIAAGRAAELGARVLLLERCNVTNNVPAGEFIKYVHPNGRFLKNAFSQFFSEDIIALLNRYGVELTLERGGRYFPSSNKSADVLKALLRWVGELGVEIRCGQRVEKLLIEKN